MPVLEDDYTLVPEQGRELPRAIPEGIVRVGDAVLASERLLTPELAQACGLESHAHPQGEGSVASRSSAEPCISKPVKIAAFDFDGTSITGNSPVLLVRHLARNGMLRKSVIARIVAWGVAYKTRLPQNESWVRGLVFSAFRGKPVPQVNEYLRDFYDRSVSPRFRPRIHEEMQRHVDDGHVVVCVSATFEPIIAKMMLEHPVHFAIATRMKVDERGCYTDAVEGLPVEGEEKVAALKRFADAVFGEDGWELGWAYGDHHSDRSMLAAAENAFAVTPDRPLTRTAYERGYEIIDCEA